MAMFAVIALKDSLMAVDEAVAKVSTERRYQIESGKWVVNSEATTAKELSEALGLKDAQSHLILPIRGYFGRAQVDLWEWLSAQSGKSNG